VSPLLLRIALSTVLTLIASCAFAQRWQPINPDDLKMTEIQAAPGANAVILWREIFGDDNEYLSTEYVRIKVLNEAGRKWADVRLPYWDKGQRVVDISGRTIHPDGSIVNFDGQVFTKVDRYHGQKMEMKTFTLPDVTVGSIIEYRYSRRWDKYTVYNTFWDVQEELYQKHAKFLLKTYQRELDTKGSTHTFWNPMNLPHGVEIKNQSNMLTLEMNDIPAFEQEENMPPFQQLAMGVYIYYGGSDIKPDSFWRGEGKDWASEVDHFIGHGGAVHDAAVQAAPESLKPEERLEKLYLRAQQIRNLSYERYRTATEEKAEDISKPNTSAEDVIKHGYGLDFQITRAFIAMARAAGFEANAMKVASREQLFFNAGILSSHQLSHEIAVVNLNGKPLYLDPGIKFCSYGLIDWRYTSSAGIQQIKGTDTKLDRVPPPDPRKAGISRAANLELDAEGSLTGNVEVLYQGLESLSRRLGGLEEDEAAHRKDIEDEAKSWFPSASEIKLVSLEGWDDANKNIKAKLTVKVPGFATSTGTRLLLPNNIFANTYKRTFDHEKRKYPVYFDYPYIEMDRVAIKLPKGVTVENLPEKKTEQTEFAYYIYDRKTPTPSFLRFDRTVMVGGVLFPLEDYPKLRTFFTKLKDEDEQQILLKTVETTSLEQGHALSK
jgi:Domain of Unknown Function with PDB structure (DUF3857)